MSSIRRKLIEASRSVRTSELPIGRILRICSQGDNTGEDDFHSSQHSFLHTWDDGLTKKEDEFIALSQREMESVP